MKKIFLIILAAAAVFAGCRKNVAYVADGKGSLSLSISGSDELNDRNINVKSVDNDLINDFDVVISRKSGEEYAAYKVGEFPELLDMVPGEYIVTVSSPDAAPVAWEQPIYEGRSEFTVMRDMISKVEVTCAVKNVKVSVNCTEKFLSEVIDYSIVITTADGSLTWNADEVNVKSGWFSAAPMNVYIKGYRKIAPEEVAELDAKIENVAPKDHIILNVDARTTGSAELSITVDGTLNDRDINIEVPGFPETPVPGGDEPENPKPEVDGPELVWEANPTFAVTPLESEMDVNVVINAPAGIKDLIVTVDSPVLNPLISGMNDGSLDMDLVNPSETLGGVLAGVGLPVKDQVSGKTSLPLNLSGLVPMIISVGQDNPEKLPGDHKFILNITDRNGKPYVRELVFRYTAE